MKLLYDQEEATQMYGESERYEEKVETAEHLIGIGKLSLEDKIGRASCRQRV